MPKKKKDDVEEWEKKANENLDNIQPSSRLEDFVWDASGGVYWRMDGRCIKTEKGVDSLIHPDLWPMNARTEKVIKPSRFLANKANGRVVEAITYRPGFDPVIRGYKDISGIISADPSGILLNFYRPPVFDDKLCKINSDFFTNHVKKIYPGEGDYDHLFDYCAHMIQKPEEKPNHGIMLSGEQGIGKDFILETLRLCVGFDNQRTVWPHELLAAAKGGFNAHYLPCIMLVVNETKEEGEVQPVSFYNALKPFLAGPPNTLPVNGKNRDVIQVPNLVRGFVLTNKPMSQYIDPNDRRIYPMHSTKLAENLGGGEYFKKLYGHLEKDHGYIAVYHWLKGRDISNFNAKQPPPMNEAKSMMVGNFRVDQGGAILQALDTIGERVINQDGSETIKHPDFFFVNELSFHEFDGKEELERLRKSNRIRYVMEELDYFAYNFEPRLIRKGKYPLKASKAFIRKELFDDIPAIVAALKERALVYVRGDLPYQKAEAPASNVVPLKGGGF